ncbi:GCN5-related N-acetyltransferase [Conidiobolus coronatus NRRL 28638]|uniref:GCN5-related N-acetyltransferase n=1 Tax=Conidiobolus coronatus (strain ATCC 28846 / CBS 209.66 / NRRL 28638) TaxID=796925 RepID=A0A137PDU9_CONC2|nr:GCN5-related N-acetyltransferase [Conidiobolus coronatus NRRL 28638]|eukprot:KXN73179.1 GCN5-related N-acetyltransferase [Conidiobolus coronatus NRRL 28638]
MNNPEIKIRKAVEADSEKVWVLMKDLAVFEKYFDSFAITPEIVRECGYKKNTPDFYCIVAEDADKIVGMLVYYFLPYTAQNRPAVYLKELYVNDTYRGQKIGEQLMNALREEAKVYGCLQIKWTVSSWNDAGKKFYERLGARENTEWVNYEWSI